ncbi:hypothetical protein V6N11_055453 [Hibiscus sabdariffa]|uniref:Uncharacterized protein n=2 Tax=Hibiscus sabdariffa TaxID=183260 RepID=A0ABR2PFB1_9ROSI
MANKFRYHMQLGSGFCTCENKMKHQIWLKKVQSGHVKAEDMGLPASGFERTNSIVPQGRHLAESTSTVVHDWQKRRMPSSIRIKVTPAAMLKTKLQHPKIISYYMKKGEVL